LDGPGVLVVLVRLRQQLADCCCYSCARNLNRHPLFVKKKEDWGAAVSFSKGTSVRRSSNLFPEFESAGINWLVILVTISILIWVLSWDGP